MLDKVSAQCLAAGNQAVVAVRQGEGRQKHERFPTQIANSAPDLDPVVIFVMRLLAPAPMSDDRLLQTNRAMTHDRRATCIGPVRLQVALRGGK